MKIEDLQDRLDELNAASLAIKAKAEAEDRDFDDDEREELDKIFARLDETKDTIEKLEKIENVSLELAQGRGRQSDPENPTAQQDKSRARIEMGRDEAKGQWGFRSFGEFAQSVRAAAIAGGTMDNRLAIRAAATTYGSEGVGADGGFTVPPDFRQAIVQKIMGEDSLLARTDQLVSSSNSITVPIDETSPWQSSGGVLAYWENEGGAGTQSKPALQQRNIRLNKLMALVPVTDELLEDAPALDSYLRRKAPEKMDFKINLALVQGTGVGQPLGMLNAPALVSVAKESGQTADTVNFNNVVKMWTRLDRSCRANAIWLIHHDVEQQLLLMEFPGTTSNVPAYLPPGGLSTSPYGTLMGRPVIPTEACETVGDKGDIFVADLTKYMTATKGGGVRIDTSMHLWFDQDTMAFRFVMRLAGQPWWASSISPRDGSTTRSCFVTLDARA